MTGRIPFGLLTLLTALVCVPIQAQDPMGSPPGNGVQPAGFRAYHDAAGQYRGVPQNYQMGPVPGSPGPVPRTMFEELPDDLGFTERDTPLGRMLTETFRHAWFRGEYLLWDVSHTQSQLLSEQTVNLTTVDNSLTGATEHPPAFQNVDYLQTANGVSGTTQVPGFGGYGIKDLNGFRGTFGLPTPVGTIELSSFLLASSSQSIFASSSVPGSLIQDQIIGNPAVTPGSSVGTDGNPATNDQTARFISQAAFVNNSPLGTATIDYDVSYQAQLSTSVWGTEGNFVIDSPDPNSPFQLRPTAGFRYLNFRDRLSQFGQFKEPNPTDATVNDIVSRSINSAAINNIYGPQVGLRSELTFMNILVGFEPKLMMGLNTWQANLDNFHVFGSADPGQSLMQRSTTFTPLVDLKGYTNVSLSKNLSAYCSYNFLWAGSVMRSFNDFTYNQSTGGIADFKQNKNYQATTLQGWTFGVEYRY